MADPLAAAVEVADLRDRDTKHFALPSGLEAKAFGKLRHFYRAGSWRDVDLTLRDRGGNVFRADQHTYVFEADASGFAIWEYDSGKGIKFLFPTPPDRVESRAAYWTRDQIEWKLELRKVGLKTTGTVAARRGPWTYHFDAQMLGGLAPPTVDANGNLSHPAFLIPRAFVDGADGSRWDCSKWRISGGAAEFDFDDTSLPDEAFPYVIDPTTVFALGASADDGTAFLASGSYPPTGTPSLDTTAATVFARRQFDGLTDYVVAVALLRWDTSSLPPGGDIASATLRVDTAVIFANEPFDLTAEWYESGSIGPEDYTDVAGTSAHTGTPLANIPAPPWIQDFELTNLDAISRPGYTGLRLHISADVPPTADNHYEFYSNDDTTHAEPELIVTYGLGTEPASYIQSMPGIESTVR